MGPTPPQPVLAQAVPRLSQALLPLASDLIFCDKGHHALVDPCISSKCVKSHVLCVEVSPVHS